MRVAEIRAKRFSMRTIYYTKLSKENLEKELNAEYRELHQLLREADIVTVHVPMANETKHMNNEEKLGNMYEP